MVNIRVHFHKTGSVRGRRQEEPTMQNDDQSVLESLGRQSVSQRQEPETVKQED